MTEELEILQHALGIDGERHRVPWRNSYCSYFDDPKLEAMVAAGLMKRGSSINGQRDRYYHVTDEGQHIAIAALPKPPSKKRQRYLDWLRISDATGETFGEYLKRLACTPKGAGEERRNTR